MGVALIVVTDIPVLAKHMQSTRALNLNTYVCRCGIYVRTH